MKRWLLVSLLTFPLLAATALCAFADVDTDSSMWKFAIAGVEFKIAMDRDTFSQTALCARDTSGQYGERRAIIAPDRVTMIGHDGTYTAALLNASVPGFWSHGELRLYNGNTVTASIDGSTGMVTAKILRLGDCSLWVDRDGMLRIKRGWPTNDWDGRVIETR
jgi:hypothetical protein